MNPAARAVAVSLETQKRHSGVAITYHAGELEIDLTAVPASPQSQLLDENGQLLDQTDHRDWLVVAADLAIDDTKIDPESGHEIEWIDADGVTNWFRVNALTGTEVWRWMDAYHVGRRIHTLLVRTS